MKTELNYISGLFIWIMVLCQVIYGQPEPYLGPDDPAGDIMMEREAYMNGNRVLLYFQNTTEMAKWTVSYNNPWSRWPNTMDGTRMLDGMALMVAARVYLENKSIPVTSLEEIRNRTDLDTLYYLQTSYREEMDTNPEGSVEWGFYPVYGYFNENNPYPAMSNLPASWPPAGWPAPGNTTKWPGEWNGRFGRGVINADLESYFVVNDAQDQEYLGPEDSVKYFPRPGVKIGDKRPEVSIQYGKPWGGIGIRVEVRGFQWNTVEARDILFWEYQIANISDYDLPEVAFGFWVDNGIGGERDDELGFLNQQIDMVYSWDTDGIGFGGLPTGIMGFAFLETPSQSYDGIDNDEDGVIDERRDNQAGGLVGPTDGISDLDNFLQFYNLKEGDLKEHFEGDEDQDWRDGYDRNGNGMYAVFDSSVNRWRTEYSEYAGDDVGLDGVGPDDLNYNGPDEGEGNHMPDFSEGIGCEPNFARTDVNEGDMIGTASFHMFPISPHSPPYTNWFRNDQSMWGLLGEGNIVEYTGEIFNLIMTFSSGPFSFPKGTEERISVAEMHAYDELAGLAEDAHQAPNLFRVKRAAEKIYENDYRFKITTIKKFALTAGVTDTLDDISGSGVLIEITAGAEPDYISVLSYADYPAHTTPMERFSINGLGRYVNVLTDGEMEWPALIKVFYTGEDLIRAGLEESDLTGIYYWRDSDARWVLYSNSGSDDTDGGTSKTGVDTANIQIGDQAFEGFGWTLAYHATPMRIGAGPDSVSAIAQGSDSYVPQHPCLCQNYPNPFNPSTMIKFRISVRVFTTLKIYNILGEEVITLVSKYLKPGSYEYVFNGKDLASGIYFYHLTAGEYRQVKKMMLIK